MKTLLISLFLVIASLPVLGQARMGSSSYDIRTEFSNREFKLESGYWEEFKAKYLCIEINNCVVYYLLNDESICYATIIVPFKQGTLNSLVQSYNEKYVIIDETTWKMYNSNGYANIKLIFGEMTMIIWTTG